MRGLIGKKIGMTRVFDSRGKAIPVTVLEVGPCEVTQVKTMGRDGYDSVQVGFIEAKEKHLTKPLIGHFNKNSVSPKRILAEFNKVPSFDYKTGQIFNVGSKENSYQITLTPKDPEKTLQTAFDVLKLRAGLEAGDKIVVISDVLEGSGIEAIQIRHLPTYPS